MIWHVAFDARMTRGGLRLVTFGTCAGSSACGGVGECCAMGGGLQEHRSELNKVAGGGGTESMDGTKCRRAGDDAGAEHSLDCWFAITAGISVDEESPRRCDVAWQFTEWEWWARLQVCDDRASPVDAGNMH